MILKTCPKTVHRRILRAAGPAEAVLRRETVPALPHRVRTVGHFIAPARETPALEQPRREVVRAVGEKNLSQSKLAIWPESTFERTGHQLWSALNV